jgi:GNAT superfamily N-acetyltransferase
MTEIRIVEFNPADTRHRQTFRDLNLAWIEKHFLVEERDRRELENPEREILEHGGRIFVAEAGEEILGVCAVIVEPDGVCELAKMAVAESARGRGVGKLLGEAVIEYARMVRAPYVELLSNTVLTPAMRLYNALGFVEVPLPRTDYARANIKMVLQLGDRG